MKRRVSSISVLYKVAKGLRGQNVLQSVVIDSTTYAFAQNQFAGIDNVAMSLYDINLVSNMLADLTVHGPLGTHTVQLSAHSH